MLESPEAEPAVVFSGVTFLVASAYKFGMTGNRSNDSYSDEETARRRDETIKRMIASPPQPHKPLGSKSAVVKRGPLTSGDVVRRGW